MIGTNGLPSRHESKWHIGHKCSGTIHRRQLCISAAALPVALPGLRWSQRPHDAIGIRYNGSANDILADDVNIVLQQRHIPQDMQHELKVVQTAPAFKCQVWNVLSA